MSDIRNRYTYYEKRHGKITQKRLEELVKEGVIESQEIPVDGTPYSFTVYNEGDIIFSFAKSRFKVKVNPEKWFK